jgi:hypothetical protein
MDTNFEPKAGLRVGLLKIRKARKEDVKTSLKRLGIIGFLLVALSSYVLAP